VSRESHCFHPWVNPHSLVRLLSDRTDESWFATEENMRECGLENNDIENVGDINSIVQCLNKLSLNCQAEAGINDDLIAAYTQLCLCMRSDMTIYSEVRVAHQNLVKTIKNCFPQYFASNDQRDVYELLKLMLNHFCEKEELVIENDSIRTTCRFECKSCSHWWTTEEEFSLPTIDSIGLEKKTEDDEFVEHREESVDITVDHVEKKSSCWQCCNTQQYSDEDNKTPKCEGKQGREITVQLDFPNRLPQVYIVRHDPSNDKLVVPFAFRGNSDHYSRFINYDLIGVVNKTGSEQYSAHCLSASFNRWYKFDDTEVISVQDSQVANIIENACIALYQRRGLGRQQPLTVRSSSSATEWYV
jgi:hypothetical protein